MDIERMWELQERMITLECAFQKYEMLDKIKENHKLMSRLMLDFDTDEAIEADCVKHLEEYSDFVERFLKDTPIL